MPTPRRTFTPEEKARIVLDILKEEKSVSQIASEAGIHANVLNSWKNEPLRTCLNCLWVTERASQKRKKCEQQIEELYAELGKLTYSIIVAQKIWPLISPGRASAPPRMGHSWPGDSGPGGSAQPQSL